MFQVGDRVEWLTSNTRRVIAYAKIGGVFPLRYITNSVVLKPSDFGYLLTDLVYLTPEPTPTPYNPVSSGEDLRLSLGLAVLEDE